MPIIDYLDLATKRIYLAAGVRSFHPVEDLYKEIRQIRRTNDTMRGFTTPVTSSGNVPKGGGFFTPRFAIINEGWKIVPEDITHALTITGELLTDDGQGVSGSLDLTALSPNTSIFIHYFPPEAEVIVANAEGTSATEIRQELDTNSARLALLPTIAQDVSATPAATATEVFNHANDGLSMDQTLRLLAAALFGKVSGAGTAEVRIRDVGDSKDRIIAAVDNQGNRLSVTLVPD